MVMKTAHYALSDEKINLVTALADRHKVSKSQIVSWALEDYDAKNDQIAARVKEETEAQQRIRMKFARQASTGIVAKPRRAPCGSAPKINWGKLIPVGSKAPWAHEQRFLPATPDGRVSSVFVPYDNGNADGMETSALVTGRIRAGINAWKKRTHESGAVFHTARCKDPMNGNTAFEVWREI